MYVEWVEHRTSCQAGKVTKKSALSIEQKLLIKNSIKDEQSPLEEREREREFSLIERKRNPSSIFVSFKFCCLKFHHKEGKKFCPEKSSFWLNQAWNSFPKLVSYFLW